MDLAKTFGTDKVREEEGQWFEIGDGARVKIARSNNPTYRRELNRLLRPHRTAIRKGTINPDLLDPAVTRALARGVLKDWEGIAVNGKAVKYSEDEAEKLMTKFPDFRELVSELSEDREAFLAEEVEAGNATAAK